MLANALARFGHGMAVAVGTEVIKGLGLLPDCGIESIAMTRDVLVGILRGVG